jgi:hypothetical protein
MKKVLSAVAGVAILASATLGVANAQGKANGPFADVPTDHWAYQSVEKLRDAGIVIGYPDGTYGGRRAMTRYEFATAIARLLQAIPPPPDLSNYVTKDQLPKPVASGAPPIDLSPYAKQSDLDGLRAEVTRRLSDDEGAIAALRDLVNQFAPELKQLGVDVAAANARIDALDARVTALEAEVRRVKITGDLNVIGRADVGPGGNKPLPVDENGFKVGEQGSNSIFAQPQVYTDFLLNIDGRVSDDTHVIVRIDAGNYVPWLGAATAVDPYMHQSGAKPSDAAPYTFNIYKAYVATPLTVGPETANLSIGRFGTQFTALSLKAINPDVYAVTPETASGDVITDGIKASFGGGNISVTAFGGNADQGPYAIQAGAYRNGPGSGAVDFGQLPGSTNNAGGASNVPSSYGSAGGYEYADGPIVRNIAGFREAYASNDKFSLGFTEILGSSGANNQYYAPYFNNQVGANSFGVFGANASAALPFVTNLTVNGEYDVNPIGEGSNVESVDGTTDNSAWFAGLGYTSGSLTLKGDYKQIDTYYAAPGYWGRIGSWINPTNIEGPEAKVAYVFSPSLNIDLEGDWYDGISNENGAHAVLNSSPLTSKDSVDRYNGTLNWSPVSDTTFQLGYEYVGWDLNTGNNSNIQQNGKAVQQFITLGVGHEVNKNTALKLLYQVQTYDDDSTGFYVDNNGKSVGSITGGSLIGQASVRF